LIAANKVAAINLRWPLADVERRHTASQILKRNVTKTGFAHYRCELLLVGKARDRFRQILVSAARAAYQSTDSRQQVHAINRRERAHPRHYRSRKLENRRPPLRLQNSSQFTEPPLNAGKISESEADRNRVKRSLREWKLQCISLDEAKLRRLTRGQLKHRPTEIKADNLRASFFKQRNAEIARAARDIQKLRIRRQEWSQLSDYRTPPSAVDVCRQEMVQQIVSRRDLREHLAHPPSVIFR